MNHGIHRIHGIQMLAMIGMAWTMNAVADYVDASNEKYVPLSYIQASGNQWIVTDIRPTCTDTVKMKFRLSTTGTQALYCSRTTMTTNTFTAFYFESVVRCDRNTSASTKGNTTLSLTDDTIFVADYAARRFFVNDVEQNVQMAAGDYTPGSVLMLFASHTFSTHAQTESLSPSVASDYVNNRGHYRLYYFELYASGSETPKHRLVPVQRKSDAAVGLYDTVGGKFYGHANNSAAFAANQSITAVSARQRYPWNGLVDLNFTITGEEGKQYATSFTAKDMVGNTNIAMRTIRKSNGAAAATKESLLPGSYSWVWDAAADLPKDWQCDRVTVTGTAVDMSYSVKFNANGGTGTMSNESFTYGTAKALTANAFKRTGYTFQGWATSASGAKVYNDKQSVSNLTETSGAVVNLYAVWKSALYMVIDLSSGSSSSSYPVSYLDAVPSGGWNNTYKTTKLVLRRCNAGSFRMGVGGEYNVTLTAPFYIGIFEVTQKHYKLVTGGNPSNFSGDTLPVEKVSYNAIRGSTNGAKWPSSSAVDSSSFMGKLRARTGLAFDLPTEAQWEYACRAGTTTTYYWGAKNYYEAVENGKNYAWYTGEFVGNANGTTHVVGTLTANAWGLYDMSGNVWEWCLDWYRAELSGGTNPKGGSSNYSATPGRVMRGGGWNSDLGYCSSTYRTMYVTPSTGKSSYGFRLCLPLSN